MMEKQGIQELADLLQKANRGDLNACLVLGSMYLQGSAEGIPKNISLAIHYLDIAAVQGSSDAMVKLGLAFKESGNDFDAYIWLTLANGFGEDCNEAMNDLAKKTNSEMVMIAQRMSHFIHAQIMRNIIRKHGDNNPNKEPPHNHIARNRHGGSRRASIINLPLSDNHDDPSRMVKINRGNHGAISLTVQGRHIRYIERFYRRKCMRDLVDLDVFPDVKEITEAEAMRHAIVKLLRVHEGHDTNAVLVIGDGATPRLGALLAYTTGWLSISVDPALKRIHYTESNRMICIRSVIEDMDEVIHQINLGMEAKGKGCDYYTRIVVAAPHSHANLEKGIDVARKAFPNLKRLDAVAMPCCVRQSLEGQGVRNCDMRYEDLGIWSAKNVIQVWSKIDLALPENTTQEGDA